MTLGDKFRAAASKIIAKFSKENGYSTLYSLVDGTDDYDTETGVVTPVYTEHQLYVAFDQLQVGAIILGNRHVEMDPSYTRDSRVAFIAGNDITPVVPKSGDLIMPAGDTERYRVADTVPDQYKALYTCMISRKPE